MLIKAPDILHIEPWVSQVELTDALVQNKIIHQSETLTLFQNKQCNLFIPFPKYQYLEVIMKSVWYLHSFPIPMHYFHISGYSPWTSNNSNSRWFEHFSISLEGSSYWESTVDANEQLHLLGGLNVVVFSKIIINKQQTFNELMLQLKKCNYKLLLNCQEKWKNVESQWHEFWLPTTLQGPVVRRPISA